MVTLTVGERWSHLSRWVTRSVVLGLGSYLRDEARRPKSSSSTHHNGCGGRQDGGAEEDGRPFRFCLEEEGFGGRGKYFHIWYFMAVAFHSCESSIQG